MKSPFAQTVEAEQPGTGLAVPLGNITTTFRPGGSKRFIAAVYAEIARLKPQLDVSTEEGRALIISTAYKVTKTKTFAFGKAKHRADAFKARAKDVMKEADFMAGELTKLSHAVRKPVTDYENKDAERNADYEMKLGEIYNAPLFVGGPTIEAIQDRIGKLMLYQSIDWQEYRERAEQGFAECFPALQAMLAKAEKDEADRVELEELRAMRAQLEAPHHATAFIDGEAIPTRAIMTEQVAAEPSVLTVDEEVMFDLSNIVDFDQAVDVVKAIKAGKIRHVQIVY